VLDFGGIRFADLSFHLDKPGLRLLCRGEVCCSWGLALAVPFLAALRCCSRPLLSLLSPRLLAAAC
jgi:hypothetical protein